MHGNGVSCPAIRPPLAEQTNEMSVQTNRAPPKRIAIIQSCYIPWKGFFDLIGRCDEYVVLDSVQFAKRHWHNRNVIKAANGLHWLTIPVVTKGRFTQSIDSVEVAEPWAEHHWRTLSTAYRRAPYFDSVAPLAQRWYEAIDGEQFLSRVNLYFLKALASELGISVHISRDRDYGVHGARSELLLHLCRAAGATSYLSGPSARAYLDERIFADAGIGVEWMSYGPYEEYPQLHGLFEHAVTILDLMFHLGPQARNFIRPLSEPPQAR